MAVDGYTEEQGCCCCIVSRQLVPSRFDANDVCGVYVHRLRLRLQRPAHLCCCILSLGMHVEDQQVQHGCAVLSMKLKGFGLVVLIQHNLCCRSSSIWLLTRSTEIHFPGRVGCCESTQLVSCTSSPLKPAFYLCASQVGLCRGRHSILKGSPVQAALLSKKRLFFMLLIFMPELQLPSSQRSLLTVKGSIAELLLSIWQDLWLSRVSDIADVAYSFKTSCV